MAELIATEPHPVAAIMRRLEVSDLGARADRAMAHRPLPTRAEMQSQLKVLEQIRTDLTS